MEVKTTCSYCGVGCGIVIKKDHKGRVVVHGDKDHPANKGMLCSKGRNLHYVVQDKSDRFLYPEMRLSKNHPRTRVSWDKALHRAAKVFSTFIEKYGPDSVGFYVSGQCLTEEYYLVNKLCKAYIGTNNIDTNSRLCMSSAVVGYKKSLGEDAVPVSYDDIELADCFFITGANPAWCHPILFRRLEKYKQENPDVKIIVADPRLTQTCAIADVHLQLNPGTDVMLNNAICKYLIDNNLIDNDFIVNHTNGIDGLLENISGLTLDYAAKICGLTVEEIEKAARYIGESKGYISMWAMGLNQSEQGVDKNLSLLNISLITGKIGKPGSGPFSLTGQPNAMGGREVGGMSNLLPAHRDLANEEHRKEVARFWNVAEVPSKPGYTATEMFEKLAEDKLKAVWIICTNPLVSMPNARMVEKALKNARFVIVQDISKNSITSEYADIIFPAAGWLEKEGTMTNSDRRISYLPKVLDAPGEAKSDSDIIIAFAKLMKYPGFNFRSAEDVFNEHRELTRGTNLDITGLTYEHLKKKGTAQWPYNDREKTETKRLFTDFKFYTPNKKANLHAIKPVIDSSFTDEFPLVLTTGRIREHWHTMTRTGKVQRLNQHIDKPFLEINPVDANSRNIKNGEVVLIRGEKGEVKVEAVVTTNIKRGVVFLPMHWGKILNNDAVRANNLTTGKVDPFSKEPDFKFTRVNVVKYHKSDERIVIIGAGAAAFRFIESYREINKTDEIMVFSAEKDAFYNRILLPEYINGQRSFNDLIKLRKEKYKEVNIKVFVNNRVASIDAQTKTIIDAHGDVYSYDKLIMCTGSSPRVPVHINQNIPGLFTLRSKYDADSITNFVINSKVKSTLISGGGLLGLETASALHELGINVTVVHRNSRLMDKQLDYTSSSLLSEQIIKKDIKVLFNDEIEEVLLEENLKIQVVFKSGIKQKFDAVVFAIGTVPNIELAKQAGLKTNKAVIVDNRLETSVKDVFAIGEIAEVNGDTYGITSAAEEQAEALAKIISGNAHVTYQGSVPMNILKFPGLELCSIGITRVSDEDKNDFEEITFSDLSMYYYKKCIIKDDRLVGAVLMGDKAEFTSFKEMIQSRQELSELRKTLLRSGKPVPTVKGKIVCSCNNVGKGNIEDEFMKGVTVFEEICTNTGAGTGCGSCKPEVKQIIAEFKENELVMANIKK